LCAAFQTTTRKQLYPPIVIQDSIVVNLQIINSLMSGKTFNMNKPLILLTIFAFAILSSCNNAQIPENEAKIITVSILPQKTILEEIAGDKFQVNVLIPEEGNHETYEPTARQMAETGKSVAYFKLGHLDFEVNWLDKLVQNYPDMKVVNTANRLELIVGEEIVHGDHVHAGGVDPHIWLSVSTVRVQAENMTKGLMELDPENAEFFEANLTRFSASLDSLDQQIREILATSETRSFMIYHPSLGYFARDYDLEQIAIEQEGKEPSPAYMKQLIDIAAEKNIGTIFVSSQFNKQSALTIAGQINAKVEEFNPISPDWHNNMLSIARQIAGSSR
jgi:zinc transport system substrate-binding protein